MKQIEDAKDQWALEYHRTNGALIADMNVLSPYFKDGNVRDVMRETYMHFIDPAAIKEIRFPL